MGTMVMPYCSTKSRGRQPALSVTMAAVGSMKGLLSVGSGVAS